MQKSMYFLHRFLIFAMCVCANITKSRHSLHLPAAYLIHIGYKTQQNGGVGITQSTMQTKKAGITCFF